MTNAQTDGRIIEKGDSLFETEKYLEAAIEYEKVYFHGTDIFLMGLSRYKRALCYKAMEDYSRAYELLMPLNPFGLNDSLYYLIKYELILNAYLAGEMQVAKANYLMTENYFKDLKIISELDYLYVLINIELLEFDLALDKVNHMLEEISDERKKDSLKQETDKLFSKKNLPRIRNEKTATYLSRFIPGSGQIYLGYIGEGLFSFSLNLAALSLGAYGIIKGYYLTGYLVGFGLLSKLHGGNQRRTEELVHIKNHNEITIFRLKLINLLDGILLAY